MKASPRPRGWADTLALRLFLLTWVTLVVSHVAAYVVVLAVLMLKPSGIFGETARKKV